jgi:chorismate mutase
VSDVTTTPDAAAALAALRARIDTLDAELVALLARRFAVTDDIGQLKARHALPPADPAREAAQRARLHALATDAGLDPAIAETVLRTIIDAVLERHARWRHQASD